MSAFLDLLNAWAIWFYLACAVGILFAFKSLVDSRRQARTTMFTLEQERAGEQALRSVLWMLAFVVVILAIFGINTFVAPSRPQLTPVATKQSAAAYTPAIVLPTFTTVPTLTPPGPTPTLTELAGPSATPTRGPKPTGTTGQATPAPAATNSPEPTSPPAPPAPGSVQYPAPVLVAPVNGESISRDSIQFRWDKGQVPAELPDGQSYKISVRYRDRQTKQAKETINCTRSSSLFSKVWPDVRGMAMDNTFEWTVQVVQVPDANSGCYNGSPLSPPSETYTFKWP